MKKKQVKRQNILQLILLLAIVGLLNLISQYVFHRFDLTQEKRYTLSPATKNFLKELDDVIFLKIYLEGNNMPAGFLRLQKATKELMDEFRIYAGTNLQYEFINPSESPDRQTRQEVYEQLANDGLMYFNVQDQTADGTTTTIPVFPAAMVSYMAHGQQLERPVNFFSNATSNDINDGTINRIIENLEYEFIASMRVVTRERVPKIAMLQGHGELDEYESAGLFNAVSMFYLVERVTIDKKLNALDEYDALIIADPVERFPDEEKFIVDQFIMRGGRGTVDG